MVNSILTPWQRSTQQVNNTTGLTGLKNFAPALDTGKTIEEMVLGAYAPDAVMDRQFQGYLNATKEQELTDLSTKSQLRKLSMIAEDISNDVGPDQWNDQFITPEIKASILQKLQLAKDAVEDPELEATIDEGIALLNANNYGAFKTAVDEISDLARDYNMLSLNKAATIGSAAVNSAIPQLGDKKQDGSPITQDDINLGNWTGRAMTNNQTGETQIVWISPTGKVVEAGAVEYAKNPALLVREQGKSNIDYAQQNRINHLNEASKVRLLTAEENAEMLKYTEGGSKTLGADLTVDTNIRNQGVNIQTDAVKDVNKSQNTERDVMIEDGRAAQVLKGTYLKAKEVLNAIAGQKVGTGGFADKLANEGMKYFGIDNLQYGRFVALINNAALTAGQQMKGSFSDRDIMFLKDKAFNENNEPATNLAIIEDALQSLEKVIIQGQQAQNQQAIVGTQPLTDRSTGVSVQVPIAPKTTPAPVGNTVTGTSTDNYNF